MRASAGTRWVGALLLAVLLLGTVLLGGMLLLSPTRFPLTTAALVATPILSGLVGVGSGLLGAHRGDWADPSLRALVPAVAGLGLLWLAVISTAWFAVHAELLPTLADDPAGQLGLGVLSTLLLPALAVTCGAAAVIAARVRAATRTFACAAFVHAARLNGLPTTGLIVRRVLRRTLPAILLVVATELLLVCGGVLAVHAVLAQAALPAGLPPMLPAGSLPQVLGIAVVGTVGPVVLGVAIRFSTGGGSPSRAAAAPAPPGATLPSESFRATELLDIRDLQLGPVPIDLRESGAGINLTVPRGQTLALVGGRGSGATRLCQAILGALPDTSPVTSGSILFDGRELIALPEREFRRLRRTQIGFLECLPGRLDPQARIGTILTERLPGGRPAARRNTDRALDLLASVGVGAPDTVLELYPQQLSAATLRRVLLARALVVDPPLVIAIDPTRGLGADAAAAFLDLLHALQRERGFTLLVVSAELDVVRRCDRVAILSADSIVKHASVRELLTEPNHRPSRRLLTGDPAGLAPADD